MGNPNSMSDFNFDHIFHQFYFFINDPKFLVILGKFDQMVILGGEVESGVIFCKFGSSAERREMVKIDFGAILRR